MFSNRRYLFAALVLVALKLWLVAAQPVVAIGGATHDDRLFLTLANNILQGEWLGDYSEFTLMKGPMYSLWIAVVFHIGLPLPLANHLLYLLACWLVVRVLRGHLPTDAVALCVFALLWWNPMSYESAVLGRILRQNLYTPTALLLFAALIAFSTRRTSGIWIRITWGTLAGVSLSALWLTREETVWVLPSVVVLFAAALFQMRPPRDWRRVLAPPVIACTAAFAVVIGAVCLLNFRHYGWFGTNEFRAPQFVAAYGALQRIQPDQTLPKVPVTRQARELAYEVSSAFAELRPHLEGPIGTGWAAICQPFTGRPPEEREIAGGWFMWALRQAVTTAGHHESAAKTLAYYQRVADEVNAACDEGRIPAGPRQDSMMPPLQSSDIMNIARTLPEFLDYFATFRGFTALPPPSLGDAGLLRLFRDLTQWRVSHPTDAPELVLPLQEERDHGRLIVLHTIGKLLRPVCAVVVIGGALLWAALALHLVVCREASYRFIVATSLFGAAFAVVLINALVHVLSFPNLSPGAFAQAYPLALLAGSLAWIDGVHRLRSRARAFALVRSQANEAIDAQAS